MGEKCKGKNCRGEINTKVTVRVPGGCYGWNHTHPCEKCGLLHFAGTYIPVINKSNEKAYFKDRKSVV